jgi:hypothetical protein
MAASALKASPATAKAKGRFILSTDGADLDTEDLESGEMPPVKNDRSRLWICPINRALVARLKFRLRYEPI